MHGLTHSIAFWGHASKDPFSIENKSEALPHSAEELNRSGSRAWSPIQGSGQEETRVLLIL